MRPVLIAMVMALGLAAPAPAQQPPVGGAPSFAPYASASRVSVAELQSPLESLPGATPISPLHAASVAAAQAPRSTWDEGPPLWILMGVVASLVLIVTLYKP